MIIKPEHVVLVDEHDREIGLAGKATVHTPQTPLHRGFSLFLFDDAGRLLLQQRAFGKTTWPGVWSNSVCGHPQRGEIYISTAQRRLEFELGITIEQVKIRVILPDYRYRYEHKGVVENEICPVMVARTDAKPHPNPDEVVDIRWIKWSEFLGELKSPNEYSEWCVEEAQLLAESPIFKDFIHLSSSSLTD